VASIVDINKISAAISWRNGMNQRKHEQKKKLAHAEMGEGGAPRKMTRQICRKRKYGENLNISGIKQHVAKEQRKNAQQ